jgi:dTDP-4-dehydrorhamnose reductase
MLEGPVWITGAGGLIGHYLLETAAQALPGASIVGLTRAELDLADFPAVRREFQRQRPALVIHCAGLSRSPDCQADPGRAYLVNVQATAVLAELAAAIPLVLFSSDLVFDGKAGHYDESAPVNPLSVYGETKVLAEQAVLANPRHTVIRTSLNGGASPRGGRAFNEELRRAFAEGQTLRLFSDEFRSPIHARVTARAVWELAARNSPGLYHVAGSQRLSRLEMGRLVAARWPALNPRIVPASIQEYAGAPRPPDTSLNCAKAQARLSFPLPGLAAWLAEHPEEVF